MIKGKQMNNRILIVDTDQEILTSLSSLLTKNGYDVETATRSDDVLTKIKSNDIDLIFLDVHLPETNGIELLSIIREDEADAGREVNLPVILTGKEGDAIPLQAIRFKADDYLHKPFESAPLLHSVSKCIRAHLQEKEKDAYKKTMELKIADKTKEITIAQRQLIELNRELEKRVEERTTALKNAQQETVRTERLAAISQVSAGIAQELKCPLASITNIGFYLKKNLKIDDPKMQELVQILSKEVIRTNKIISDLLDFSHAKKLNKKEAAVNEIIDQFVRGLPPCEGIVIEKKLVSGLPIILVDTERLLQALANLYSNACDAMNEKGTITLETRLEKDDQHESYVAVIFQDTGCGINKESMEHVFDPLFSTKMKGIGLGLAATKDIIEAHKGKLYAASEEGRGTAFTLLLPIKGDRDV
jgi:signal transduction histidine kinase